MLKASMRDKKRYVATEKNKGDIIEVFKRWYGLRSLADSNLKKIMDGEKIEIYRIKPQYVERFRVACMLINKRILRVSGTLKALKRKIKDDYGYEF